MSAAVRWFRTVTFIVASVAACAGQRLPASELVQRDLIFSAGELPNAFSYSVNDGTGARSGTDAFSQNIGVSVGGRYSFAGPGDASGLVLGGALVANQASYASIGHYTGYGLRLDGGYGWAITDRWTVGGQVEVGYGLATFDIQSTSAFAAASDDGSTYSYGVAFDLDYTITSKLTLLLDLGYLKTIANLSGSGVTIKLNNSGFAAALGIAWRFSDSPRTLE